MSERDRRLSGDMSRGKCLIMSFAAVAIFNGAVADEISPDGVPVVPLFLDDGGNGILRYSDPNNASDEYFVAFGGLSDDPVRPFEVLGTLGGPWMGPYVAVCIEGMTPDRMMGGALAFQLFSQTSDKPVIRFRPQFEAAKAEKILSEGEGAAPGECSRNYAP